MAKPKYYAVRVGRKPGVYNTWDECRVQVDGYPKADFKGFGSAAEAKSFVGAANSAKAPGPARAPAVKRGGAVIEVDIHKRRKSADYQTVAPLGALMPPQSALLPQQAPLQHSQQRQLTSAANTAVPPGTNLQSPEQQEVVIYFDGGSRKNPGRAGYGYAIYDSKTNKQLRLGCRAIKYGSTNNQAEYTGMIEGVKFAIEQLGARRLIVRGDSELVVRQMTGIYRANSEKLMPLFESAQQLANRCSSFTIEHVYREDNQMADKLSNLAMDMDLALDEMVDMWRRGNTGRAGLVQRIAKAADVVANHEAVNRLGQSASFLGAVAELVSQMWDLSQQEAVQILQAKGWTEAIGGAPLEQSTLAGSSSDLATHPTTCQAASGPHRSGRGTPAVAVAAATLGGSWGSAICRQEHVIMHQQQQQQNVGVGSSSGGGGGGGVGYHTHTTTPWLLPRSEGRSTTAAAAMQSSWLNGSLQQQQQQHLSSSCTRYMDLAFSNPVRSPVVAMIQLPEAQALQQRRQQQELVALLHRRLSSRFEGPASGQSRVTAAVASAAVAAARLCTKRRGAIVPGFRYGRGHTGRSLRLPSC